MNKEERIKEIEHPTKCNLCGGDVEYISNAEIYGRPYGNGFAYRCKGCYAYVGTHKYEPKRALGILADEKMREKKTKCHALFDRFWKTRKERKEMYVRLAKLLDIETWECHFGWFDSKMLDKAYSQVILLRREVE